MSTDTGNTNQLLNEIEVAELLGVSRKTLQAWRWRRVGPPFVKLGSAVRYSYVDLLDFLESNKTYTTSAN